MLRRMARAGPVPQRVAEEFGRSLGPAPGAIEVLRGAASSLLGAVPGDFWCGVLLDPSTLLDTGGLYTCSFPEEMLPRLFEIEHVEHAGADHLRSLAGRASAVSVLSESTRGRLDADVYYRDILRPLGMRDEMRVLLRHGSHAWGLLVWCRSGDVGFSARDVAVASALARPAATALRGALLTGGADPGDLPDAPGMLVVARDGTVVSASPAARRWLDELQEAHPEPERLPNTVRALSVRAAAASLDRPARCRALTRRGRWVSLHGWAMDDERVVVGIGPAGVEELVAVVLDAYGLTIREREVTQHVLRGRSNAQIATAMSLSTHTVQDHLRAIFRKVDVSGCRELMSAVFGRHYLPHLHPGRGAPLSTDGRLDDRG